MIDFEEELEKFQFSLDVDQAEEAIFQNDMTDITDLVKEMIKEAKDR